MDTWIWIAIAAGAAVLVLLAVAVAVSHSRRRARTERLRDSFGPEYDRTVDDLGHRRGAETELEARLERRAQLDIRPLEPEREAAFRDTWREVQAQFVEAPTAAVASANGLVVDVMRERGYPIEDFDQRAADISVDHPVVVERYRAAREIALRRDAGLADTEELRQAMVHVGALLDELLSAEQAGTPPPDEGSVDGRPPSQLAYPAP
jgi:hypothetical protein